jgi:hypothetical protein
MDSQELPVQPLDSMWRRREREPENLLEAKPA